MQIVVTVAALAFLGVIIWLEAPIPPAITMPGATVLVAIFATWTLPRPLNALVALSAVCVPLVTLLLGGVDPVGSATETIVVLVATVAVSAVVRALERAERQQQAYTQRIFDLSQSLERFTANAAHELRAPLAIVQTEAELGLSQQRSVSEYRARLGAIGTEAQRMSRITDALLLLARADAGVLTARMELVDLTDLIEVVAARWRQEANTRGIHIVTAHSEHARLFTDDELLERVLDNLCDNAVRYSSEASQVQLRVRLDMATCVLEVENTGPPIPERLRPLLFERFMRGSADGGRQREGAGLGLALCKAIIDSLRGTIELVDRNDCTLFRVVFPNGRGARHAEAVQSRRVTRRRLNGS